MKRIIQHVLKRFGLQVTRSHLIPVDGRQLRNIVYLGRMFEHIKDVGGNVVECGVGKGRTFLYFSLLAQQEGKRREVWGFDSFEGFPEPSKEDASRRNPKKGEWAGTAVSDIIQILKQGGVDRSFREEHVHIVKGFFRDSLKEYSRAPIALLHVDVDLYQSYRDVLGQLFPLVAKGGVVLFDEYDDPNWPGAKKAIDEFLAGTPSRLEKDEISGKYFLVKQ